MSRNFGIPPREPSPPGTYWIGAGAIIVMVATLAYAVWLAMRMHGHA